MTESHGGGPFDEQGVLFEQLTDAVREARESVEAGRAETARQIQQAQDDALDRQQEANAETERKNRNTLIIAAALVAFALAFSGFSWHRAHRAQNAADTAQVAADTANEAIAQIELERAARTTASCEAARAQALSLLEKDRALLRDIAADLNLFRALLQTATSEQGIALGQAYVAEKAQLSIDIENNQARVRICTDEAIAAWFASDGTEGIEPPVDLTVEGNNT